MKNSIVVQELSKVYKLYNNPQDRLKESLSISRKLYHSEFFALKNISFEVKKGETLGIVGKNGSGKSTLLKILTGVLSASSGNVQVAGKVAALLELGAGFNMEYTGIENIYLQGTIMGYSKSQMDERIQGILDFADIGEYVYQPVKTYSSGMFARLAFAVAINVDPEILIIDEALAVGDMKFQAKCFNRMNELKESGATILFVGHDVSSIRTFCDKALWIHQGEMRMFGETLEVTAEYMKYMNDDEVNEREIINHRSEDFNTEFEAINRWGSQQGIIKYVEIFNSKKEKTSLIKFGEKVCIKVISEIPKNIDMKYCSVAFSIKNKVGTDLIVSTTYDHNHNLSKVKSNVIEVNFEFENYLKDDEYILVVAIENRSNMQPEYYDYIEGAKYFRIISDKKIFGYFHPPVSQSISFLKE
ncbi:ABC transporter ATP-binding protein [Solibacillus merdavium]|uniref:ABC transporter ATP-binding protein n=1 Tax=Solibacillus merdavium TaxID=2762218 RepID=A0ABR8XKV8_9BACL|nr:ABC transporter ATP-binding protein [Solibacillus merdavium]MBD8032570.1 ABC transporter ATP-binding protein [Solibacillus merdavium]